MFEDLEYAQLELIYLGLKSLIESGSGHGFHNSDMGHPVYLLGTKGKIDEEFGDSPRQNDLFQLLSGLSKKLKAYRADEFNWWYDFSNWQDFCKFAVLAYRKRHGLVGLTEDEADKLISACRNDKQKLIIMLLLYTGLRVSDISNLKKENIIIQDGKFDVQGIRTGVHVFGREQDIVHLVTEYFKDHESFEISQSSIIQLIKRNARKAEIDWRNITSMTLLKYWSSLFEAWLNRK
jgi:integrase